jgi:hypothetical protein
MRWPVVGMRSRDKERLLSRFGCGFEIHHSERSKQPREPERKVWVASLLRFSQ